MVEERALRLTIYVAETAHFEGKPIFRAIVEYLRTQGVPGATAVRAIYGYGGSGVVRASASFHVTEDVPIIIQAVDREEKLRPLLPTLHQMISGGLITLEDVRVVHHDP